MVRAKMIYLFDFKLANHFINIPRLLIVKEKILLIEKASVATLENSVVMLQQSILYSHCHNQTPSWALCVCVCGRHKDHITFVPW
jgi:hypothetical protein